VSETPVSQIESWHSHVYFDPQSRDIAATLRDTITQRFAGKMQMGRFHERPVGPHPMFSFQIAYQPEHFAEIMSWLAINRGELIVLTHPNAGDDLRDHRDWAIWMGAKLDLNLDALK